MRLYFIKNESELFVSGTDPGRTITYPLRFKNYFYFIIYMTYIKDILFLLLPQLTLNFRRLNS
jgi:hypothetical protein